VRSSHDCWEIRDGVRRHPARKRKRHARKELLLDRLRAIASKISPGLKQGEQKGRNKSFRSVDIPARAPADRAIAQDHPVWLVAVDPRGASRICPESGTEDRRDRRTDPAQAPTPLWDILTRSPRRAGAYTAGVKTPRNRLKITSHFGSDR
jgi:hypothetical protein